MNSARPALWVPVGGGLLLVLLLAWHSHRASPLQPGQPILTEADQTGAEARSQLDRPAPEKRNVTGASLSRELNAAINNIMAEPDDARREAESQALVDGTDPANLPVALSLLQAQVPNEVRRDLLVRLVRRWSETAPEMAGAWAEQLPPGAERAEALNGVAICWANQNLADAITWVRGWAAPDEQRAGLLSIAYEAARTDAPAALRLALGFPESQSRDDLIVHAVSQWAAVAPEPAAEWGRKISESPLSRRVLSAIATAWGDSDPVAAGSLAVSALPPGTSQNDAVMGILLRWAQKEPEAAKGWAEQFPHSRLRSLALEELAKLAPPPPMPQSQ